MSRPVYRPEPLGGPGLYKTYQIVAPSRTHFRDATCAEVECERRLKGFRTSLDTSDDAHSRTAKWIENHSGRRFTREMAGTIVTYTFGPGQDCFTPHRVSLEREPFYFVKDGDYRGNPYGTRPVQRRAGDWVDDFATHQQAVKDRCEKG